MKTYNMYCDESCHLENDRKPYMLLSYVSVSYNQMKDHSDAIKALKEKHHFYAEIKWSKVSKSKIVFYNKLVDYFFQTDLRFRAIVVDKRKFKKEHGENFDAFYYKMYYQLLHHKMSMEKKYNIYLDIKDTLSAQKVTKLRDILRVEYNTINNLQNIRSHESIFMQLTDFMMGALSYNLNDDDKKMIAKEQIIERIGKRCGNSLKNSTYKKATKFNLFFIDLK